VSKELTMGQLAALMHSAAKKVDPAVSVKLRTVGQAAVGIVKGEIQGMHIVDTGTTLNSVSVESAGKDTLLIGPTTSYAPYVALGTRFMAARPFHLRARPKIAAMAKDFLSAEDLGI
jgi:phage gpG-like protein